MTDTQTEIRDALLQRHGTTFAAELGIDPADNTPSPLFRWFCAALLMSAPISAKIAVASARALAEAGWTTAEKMAASRWEDRVRVLNGAGYGRYDERTARMLGEAAEVLLDRYGGDLRRLREEAERDPQAERRLLKAFKGIGDVGADIFFREVQTAWDELEPFADARALKAAHGFGLPDTAEGLSRLAGPGGLPRLLAAIVRADLAGESRRDLRDAAG
jgi:hypothetical protein